MAAKKEEAVPLDKALVRAFATNERINQFLLENLDEAAWRADPPGGRGRAFGCGVRFANGSRESLLPGPEDLPLRSF